MTKALDFSLPGYADSEEYDSDALETISSLPTYDDPELRCCAHILQLVMMDGLKDIGPPPANCHRKSSSIVKFSRKSLIVTDILEDEKRFKQSLTQCGILIK